MRNRTSDLRIPRSNALPLSHRDSTVNEVYYEVHMTSVLHTAWISKVLDYLQMQYFYHRILSFYRESHLIFNKKPSVKPNQATSFNVFPQVSTGALL